LSSRFPCPCNPPSHVLDDGTLFCRQHKFPLSRSQAKVSDDSHPPWVARIFFLFRMVPLSFSRRAPTLFFRETCETPDENFGVFLSSGWSASSESREVALGGPFEGQLSFLELPRRVFGESLANRPVEEPTWLSSGLSCSGQGLFSLPESETALRREVRESFGPRFLPGGQDGDFAFFGARRA